VCSLSSTSPRAVSRGVLGLEVDACLGGAREDDGLPVDDGEEGEARRDAQARTGVATQLSHPLSRGCAIVCTERVVVGSGVLSARQCIGSCRLLPVDTYSHR
jgi:hypothetical protein